MGELAKTAVVAGLLYTLYLTVRARRIGSTDEMAARRVLGVGPRADEAAIRKAHRTLVSALHPDRGGSLELTRQINAARDTLLKRRLD